MFGDSSDPKLSPGSEGACLPDDGLTTSVNKLTPKQAADQLKASMARERSTAEERRNRILKMSVDLDQNIKEVKENFGKLSAGEIQGLVDVLQPKTDSSSERGPAVPPPAKEKL